MNQSFPLMEYQAELLKLFRRVYELFQSNGVSYYCVYGTCLGALRHKGMIPWDDDIDIAVRRSEVSRVVQVITSCAPDLYVWSLENDPCCSISYMRIYFRIKDEDALPHKCAFVDVWVLDNIPNSKIICTVKHIASAFFRRVIDRKHAYRLNADRWKIKGLFFNILGLPFRLLPFHVLLYLYRKSSVTQKTSGVLVIDWFRYMPEKYFIGNDTAVFDGLNVPVPAHAPDYLAELYGDWTKFPTNKLGHAIDITGNWMADMPADSLRML